MVAEVETLSVVYGICDWLRAEADRRGIPLRLFPDGSRLIAKRYLNVPADIVGIEDVMTAVNFLQDLEDAWNEQDPEPDFRLTLLPAGVPEDA